MGASATVPVMAVEAMFPLGTVLVPSMALPLHVFEPRYRQLVADALEGEGTFAVVLIERGSEVGGGDVRTDVGTRARIVEAAELGGGRLAIGAIGIERIRVERWLQDDPYPRAEVAVWPDPPAGSDDRDRLGPLAERLRRSLAMASELGESVPPAEVALSDDPALASHQLAGLAPLGPLDRQALLAAPTIGERLDRFEVALADLEELLELRLGAEGSDPDLG